MDNCGAMLAIGVARGYLAPVQGLPLSAEGAFAQ